VRSELFQPTISGEARLLLLIDAFSGSDRALEGRTKLAKLDFFLRYPNFFKRALEIRASGRPVDVPFPEEETIESRMIRFRYGPRDPAYYALLGRLIGHGLIEPVPIPRGIGYRTTERGRAKALQLSTTEAWAPVAQSARLLKRHFDLSGTTLKNFIYNNFPEVSRARWGSNYESTNTAS
jgi:hypothetical protein